MRQTFLAAALALSAAFAIPGLRASVTVECESFADHGGWGNDTQFVDQMGSPYLIAHGLGRPVRNARTAFTSGLSGPHEVWVRTKNWTAPWHKDADGAGRFAVIVNGERMPIVAGSQGQGEWIEVKVGETQLKEGENALELQDIDGFDGRCDWVRFRPVGVGTLAVEPNEGTVAAADVREVDLCVAGAGIAGICTAVSAARLGLRVALVNDRPILGGNNSSEVRVHLGAWQNMPPYPRLGDVLAEFGPRRIGNAEPAETYEDDRKLAVVRAETNITLVLDCRIDAAVTNLAGAITEVSGRDTRSGVRRIFRAKWFADCTGDGTVGYLAGADWRMGREAKSETGEPWAPEKPDMLTLGASVQWRARTNEECRVKDEECKFPFRPWMIRFDDANGRAQMKGDWDWEAGLGRDQVAEAERIRDYGLLVAYSNWGFVKNVSRRRNEFRFAELEWVAYIAGRRESRRLMGDFVLSERHILERDYQPDGTCAATWTIDLHFPKTREQSHFDGEPFRSNSENERIWPYPIPYRCCYSRNVRNLFMAGRDISVTHIALGTTRLQRTHGMLGEVVGMAAAVCKRHGCEPRDVYTSHLEELKDLMRKGVGDGKAYPPQMYNIQTSLDPEFRDFKKGNYQIGGGRVPEKTVRADGEMVANGGFEKGREGWALPKAWKLEDGVGRNGSKALVWENADPDHYAFPVYRVAFEPGGIYRFGAWVKVEEGEEKKVSVSIDWSDANGKWLGSSSAHPVTDNDPNTKGWTHYTGVSRQLPSNAAKGNVLCYLRKGCTGRVLFDDFTLVPQASRPIEYLQCSAYHNSFSSEDGIIRFVAALHINTVRNPLESLKGIFSMRGADGRTCSLDVTVFDADHAEIAVEAAAFPLGAQEVSFRIVRDGKDLDSAKLRVTKTERPVKRRVAIDAKGRVILEGRPFFPIGMYTSKMSDEDLAVWKQAGFNFAMQYGKISPEDLDRWQSVGTYAATDVRSLIHGYNYSAKSKYRTPEESQAAFRRKYEEIGRHPALFAWYLVDEAPLEFVPNIAMANEFLHEIDPDHPTYTVTDKPWDVRSLLPCYDVIGMDPYPIGNHGGRAKIAICSQWTDEAREGMFGLRPMWHVPQAFNWGWYRPDEAGKTPNLRFPTRREYANMTWQGIAGGANGLCSYAFHSMRKNLKGEAFDRAWGDVCAVTREVKALVPVLLSDGDPMYVGGVPKDLVVRTFAHDGKDWALVVNRTEQPVKAKLALPRAYAAAEIAAGDGVSLVGDMLDVALDGLGYAFVALRPGCR